MRHSVFARILLAVAAWAAVAAAGAVEPTDVGSPQLRLSTTLAWPPAVAASGATFSDRMQQPASALQAQATAREGELLQAMDQAQRQQKQLNDLEARIAQAQAERRLNPLVVALAGLLVALATGSAVFWLRLRRVRAGDEA